MKQLIVRLPLALGVLLGLANCKSESPALTGPPKRPEVVSYAAPRPDPKNFEETFKFDVGAFTATQEKYNENEITVQFQVAKDGKSVNNLKEQDFSVTENNVKVTPFKLIDQVEELKEVADIVFVFDVTNSMAPFLHQAKQRLTDFIRSTKKDNYHIRMCLSTFGDYVVSKCNRFYDNTDDKQVADFIRILSGLRVSKGNGEEKGFDDWEENSMRALTDATHSEWSQGSKRFAVLVTDADFYSPDKPLNADPKKAEKQVRNLTHHQSQPETSAPTMKEVTQAINESGVRVIAMTPQAEGYNLPLNGEPPIVKSENDFFEFTSTLNGQKSLDQILSNILNSINTTYTLIYSVEKTGLNPTLPLSARKIAIQTDAGTVKGIGVDSTMKDGRPNYKQVFKVSDDPVQPDSVKVFVNDHLISATEYTAVGTEVSFKDVPPPGANLRITYNYADVQKNLKLRPIMIPGVANASTTKVLLNGKPAREGDILYGRDLAGNTVLSVSPKALADPFYDIRQNNGLRLRVTTNL